jgi:hypothetical protein
MALDVPRTFDSKLIVEAPVFNRHWNEPNRKFCKKSNFSSSGHGLINQAWQRPRAATSIRFLAPGRRLSGAPRRTRSARIA